jgi:hypothetical protein
LSRTRKANLLWRTTCETMEELRVALLELPQRNQETGLRGRHRDNTPLQVRQAQQAARAPQVA